MDHHGITYEIKIAPGPNEWVWIVHTPNPKKGSVKGSRDRAMQAAMRTIERHCHQHPKDCIQISK